MASEFAHTAPVYGHNRQGDWSDNSECWTRRLRRKLAWEDSDDGTFWMSFDDFCLAFRNLYVCHYYHPEQPSVDP